MLTEGNHVKPRSGSQVGANKREENKEYIHYLSMVSSQPCVGPDEQESEKKPEPECVRRQNHPVQDEKMDDTFTKLAKSVVMILSIFFFYLHAYLKIYLRVDWSTSSFPPLNGFVIDVVFR